MICIGIDIGGSSVKAAAIVDGQIHWTVRSGPYSMPNRDELLAAMRTAIEPLQGTVDRIGLCLPGLYDESRRAVTLSVNVPGISGVSVDELIAGVLGPAAHQPKVFTDAHATAHDLYTTRQLTGRLFMLALGTGVGATVLDDEAAPLHVDGNSPGHFGQLDVSIEGEAVIGPDGGAGSLEGYIGALALRGRWGERFIDRLASLAVTEPPVRALVRAVRIAHALYRPHHVILAGGIGIRLKPILAPMQQAIGRDLTRIARPDWTLTSGDSDYHAALGAAKLAMRM